MTVDKEFHKVVMDRFGNCLKDCGNLNSDQTKAVIIALGQTLAACVLKLFGGAINDATINRVGQAGVMAMIDACEDKEEPDK